MHHVKKNMDIFAKTQKVLKNYNAKKFHENLKRELKSRHIPITFFCEKIGRNAVWFSRSKERKPQPETLAAIEREFNLDILKLAGIESDNHHAIKISHYEKYDKEIMIQGVRIKLNAFYHKVKVLLSYPHEHEILIGFVDNLYKTLQNKIRTTDASLKNNTQ